MKQWAANREMLNVELKMLNMLNVEFQHREGGQSALQPRFQFDVQHSPFNIQHSAFRLAQGKLDASLRLTSRNAVCTAPPAPSFEEKSVTAVTRKGGEANSPNVRLNASIDNGGQPSRVSPNL